LYGLINNAGVGVIYPLICLRAFNLDNGEELWKGRQYVVIFAGGYSRIGSKLGDYLVAFGLPEHDGEEPAIADSR